MIKLSELVVMVANHDGTVIEFEAEQFQTEIIRSFLAAENNELWVAEDIVMAVEYALLAHDSDEKIFSLTEIESIIIGILEDAGFAEVAESYRRTHRQRHITFSPERNYLLQLLNRHAGLTGRNLEAVTDKVIVAGSKLHIDAAAPELFVELAKYYKSQLLNKESPALEKLVLPTSTERLRRISISIDKIKEQLNEASVSCLNKNIIQLYSISSLFPAVRIAINMKKVAEHAALTPPVTELLLLPNFSEIANAVNDVVKVTEAVFHEYTSGGDLPLYISVPDMAEFAEYWLEADWPECRPCCRDMMSFLEEMLERKPFKLTMG
jgi:hypothetical protein